MTGGPINRVAQRLSHEGVTRFNAFRAPGASDAQVAAALIDAFEREADYTPNLILDRDIPTVTLDQILSTICKRHNA